MVIFVAYAEGKEVTYIDNKLVHYPKIILPLSLSRTQSDVDTSNHRR